MEELDNIRQKLNVPTVELKLGVIQEVLIKAKQYKAKEALNDKKLNLHLWNEISEILWMHLLTGFKNMDDELLCAICLYSTITCTDKHDYFLNKVLDMIKSEINMKTDTSLVVSLMYGMFQSSFFSHDQQNAVLVSSVLEYSFDLLTHMSYEYTKYTFLAFKTINNFKRVCGTTVEHAIFNKQNQIKLLNVVNHNWENPVTGVRDLIRSIFQTVIKMADETIFKSIVEDINGFYWNKAKYFMLSEIFECKVNDISVNKENSWVEGLMYSLHKPGLVSAGSDMYYVILKLIKSEDDWCSIFMSHIAKILAGESSKAIENFHNYWCLTTFKKFPSVMQTLLEVIVALDKPEQTFYSTLCVMKQGNKLGLLNKDWEKNDNRTTKTILIALEHNNKHVRMLAFDIVCTYQEKALPSETEYSFVLEFLHNNVNTDSTVLRLAMLGSFKYFLTQLHISFVNYINKSNPKDINNLVQFVKSLQEFIIISLNLNGNYQRKITIVKIINIIFNCFHEVPRKRRDQTKPTNIKVIEFLTERKVWVLDRKFVPLVLKLLRDPTNDIRENVIQLLLNHFSNEFKDSNLMQNLKQDAFLCMKSKFFYEIDCGKDMLKLLTNLLLRENQTEQCQDVEDIFYAGYNQLIEENKLKMNIMNSIENGRQLHSFISVLHVVIEACILNSYKINISQAITMELLSALEDITSQFTWEQHSSSSSDFSKMNEMVEDIIIKSGHYVSHETNESKISGQHQIVLNCLWLNVKACCDFVSLIIQYYSEDTTICKKSLNILTHVLETSRHKGAIESAGSALGRAIQHLTSLSDGSNASKLPYILLKSKLNDLIQQAGNMASVTRRGAGLSIMVHRIVSSDMKKGKPLFNYFMENLLETCDKTEDIPHFECKTNIENQMDLPKAIYIHFLTKIVTDNSLATDVTYYSAKLAQLAFNNLTSSHWQIRNAALQLYGALVPRQIGQKKASGIDDETIATVAYDELRTHCPKLWLFITSQLKNENSHDDVQSHSNLVSVLNLLANSAKRYNFLYNIIEQKPADTELLNCLVPLLGSPIYTVRRLCAKCIFNVYSFETIYEILIHLKGVSENSLHGHLMLLRHCHKYYHSSVYKSHFQEMQLRFDTIFTEKKHSYVCREIFDSIFLGNVTLNDLKTTFDDAYRNFDKFGVDLWVITVLQKYILYCPWNELPEMLQMITDRNYLDKCCEFIIIKLESTNIIPNGLVLDITNILLLSKHKYASCLIWNLLYQITLKVHIENIDFVGLLTNMNEGCLPYTMRYMLPFVVRVMANKDTDLQLKISKIIYNLSNPDKADVDMRYIAALANNEMTYVIDDLSDTTKILMIKSAVNLFQDEDEDVRNLSVIFYKNISKEEMPLNPYICLQRILNPTFLKVIFKEPQDEIKILCNDLSEMLKSSQTTTVNYNPFVNDSKNIYFENEVLKGLIEKLRTVANE